ncbi:MAG: DUF86 domain-containing protein [Bacteroidaceae bacterium]|nr:DUF86 domain-containing protein [Bacteroidaceae bacterium]MBQ9170387.1 DUF86 domain-containing protein [Bacteroidaceae bacterium]MBQ9293572.1 DUF86 domain-containing protein [Bacteroidaceae bacterium]
MYDSVIARDILQKISIAVDTITERASAVKSPNELLCSAGGMMRLDAICMNLIALGEAVKGLDKQTHGELLPQYPEMYWSGVMRMRDKIAHHYFEIDVDVVFRTIQEDIPQLKKVIDRMISDLK